MSDLLYQWKRFWCPRNGRIHMVGAGYLADPDSEVGRLLNRDTVEFVAIASLPCLALLGEPGLGKSHALNAERAAIEAGIVSGDRILWLDLRSYGSEDRLVRDLFECGDFLSWADGDFCLHLFLDSLDECLLRLDHVASLLVEQFGKFALQRLRLRIACRTAEWPSLLDTALPDLWGKDSFGAYELAPLRRTDVAHAASASGIDAEAFLRAVEGKGVVPLAIKPVTLQFLLNLFQQNHDFPSTQAELYFQGCRVLCEEINESRRSAGRTGTLTADQRVAVATRIAAVTVFANRSAIRSDPDLGTFAQSELAVRTLCGGCESVVGSDLPITEQEVRETLTTALFSSRGPNALGWAHQTYAEFLAARYLTVRGTTLHQTMGLLTHPGDPDGKLVPQLHETAAWLAGMDVTVFRKIRDVDPEVLLRSDVATADSADRVKLVSTLLELYDQEKLLDMSIGLRFAYRKLLHPDIAEQLRPYIADTTKGLVVRRVAIDIAEACELTVLQELLADVTLDPAQMLDVRTNAAHAVFRIGDPATKGRLRPLVSGTSEDVQDELKGCALRSLWPDNLTADELFPLLTSPKQYYFTGAYAAFLSTDIARELEPADLPRALQWVRERRGEQDDIHYLEKLADVIMVRAWEQLDAPGMLDAFTRAALTRLAQQHHAIVCEQEAGADFARSWQTDDTKRQKVLARMIALRSNVEREWHWLFLSTTGGPVSRDMPWLLEQMSVATTDETRRDWLQLIQAIFRLAERDHLRMVLKARRENPILAAAFPWWHLSLALYWPWLYRLFVRWKQGWWELRFRWKHGRWLRQPRAWWRNAKATPAQRIARLLKEFDRGSTDAWCQLHLEMLLEPTGSCGESELEADLTKLPGWRDADEAIRARLVDAARRYLIDHDPKAHTWISTNHYDRPACAGYRALRLLQSQACGTLAALPIAVWQKWAPMVVAYPAAGNMTEADEQLVALAYHHAPTEILDALRVRIDTENSREPSWYVVQKMRLCWDERLGKALMAKIQDPALKPELARQILTDLLVHDQEGARIFAASKIPNPIPADEVLRRWAILSAVGLLMHTSDAGWSIVWPAIQADVVFGQEVVTTLTQAGMDWRAESLGKRLKESELADLYIWAVRQFPPNEDPKEEGAHNVNSRESIGMWRDSLLNQLQHRGTFQSCQAIERIIQALPEITSLKWVLAAAQDLARSRTWVPPEPVAILAIGGLPAGLFEALQNALLSAFNQESLQRMLRTKLDVWLDHIAGHGTFTDVVCNVINWAERNGKVQELVCEAAAFVPGNGELQRVVREFEGIQSCH
jgi:Effector-associated domain 1